MQITENFGRTSDVLWSTYKITFQKVQKGCYSGELVFSNCINAVARHTYKKLQITGLLNKKLSSEGLLLDQVGVP